MTYAVIASRVGVSVATVGRVCAQAGVAKLPPLEAAPPKRRYERQTPGEQLHLDTKKLAHFNRPGHRVTGDVTQSSRRPGYHALHVAIDDHSRVGFSLILPDETACNAIKFVFAALRYYKALGVRITSIITDNGSAYRSKKFAKLLRRLKIKHVRTRPYTPRTNGKAERFIQTLCGNGRMPTPTQIQPPERLNCHSGFSTTISIALIQLRAANRPLPDSALP